jgi:porin
MKPFLASMAFFPVVSLFPSERTIENPFAFDAGYLGESLTVVSGGIGRGSTYEGLATMGVEFDTEAAGLFKGGRFRLSGANTHGKTPSESYIGDYQIVSNIEAGPLTFLQELWYRQEVGRFTFIAGLQDLNVELVASQAASLFVNSSFGTPSTVGTNIPSPIFPLTSLGFQAHYRVNDVLTLKLAAFDGMPEDHDSNPYNLTWKLCSDDGYLAFSEVDYEFKPESKYPGFYRVGFYWHDHPGGKTESSQSPFFNYGFYLSADQSVYSTSSGRDLTAFLLLGSGSSRRNENPFFLGGGFRASGWFEKRKDDQFGLAVAYAGLNKSLYSGETVLEATYSFYLNKNASLQPDLQYVINPSGPQANLSDALVGLVRLSIGF